MLHIPADQVEDIDVTLSEFVRRESDIA